MKRQNPLAVALLSCSLLILAGIVGIAMGYVMVARTLDVFDQVPAMVSGGIGGIALVIVGCVLGYVQVGRYCAERERVSEDQLIDRIGAMAELERQRIAAGPNPAPKPRARRSTAKRVSV